MKNEDEKSVRTFDINIAYRGNGALAADLGSIIEQGRRTVYRAEEGMLVYRNRLIGKSIAEKELKDASLSAFESLELAIRFFRIEFLFMV